MPNQSIVLTQSTSPAPARGKHVRPVTLPLGELADRWVKIVSRRRAKGTAALYRDHVLRFCEWLEGQGVTLGGQVSPDSVAAYGEAWQAHEQNGQYKAATVNNHLNAIRLFLRWLIAEGAVFERAGASNDPWITESRVKEWLAPVHESAQPTRKQNAPTNDEVQRLRAAVTNPRDFALFTFLAGSGLRVSECCALRACDFTLRPDGAAIVHVLNGKGGKDRDVVIAESVVRPILDWCATNNLRLGDLADSRPIWTPLDRSRTLTRSESKGITRIRVYQLLEQYCTAAGLTHKVSPHNLRHYFGTELYRNTKDPDRVASALGHSGLGYIQTYVKSVEAAEAEPNLPGWERKDP